ncbi:MAG: histidine--tRNA ligase [Desulfococcaceae bacterium]|jgi:histidyl-tRNA synthetase|nr:histidine--tRNA ligase [Desulfococcaceae bacterium]
MIQLIRGCKDILPGETELWQKIEETAKEIFEDFSFREIRIPIMEKTELFARSIGEHTDIVEKEMYTFPDRGGEMLTLRPEATASIVRSYIQHKMYAQDPVRKFYTIGPMFRRERPQKGRYRQFYQINAEILGVAAPFADAQLIYMLTLLFSRLSVTDVTAHINSLGCPECRPDFREALLNYLSEREEELCADCRRRSRINPLRTLDCKVPKCREQMKDAPAITDWLCGECRTHFEKVQKFLHAMQVPFEIDKRMVRGLDYYTRTTFEILTGSLGAQSAVAGGGRYDGLIKILGGPDMPAIGFAIGLDRLTEICGINAESLQRKPALYIAALGENCQDKAFEWICALGQKGICAETDMEGKSLKSQMKRADRLGSPYVLILGEDELASGHALLRNMKTKEQTVVPIENLPEKIIGIIK